MFLNKTFQFLLLLTVTLGFTACTSGLTGTASYDDQGRYEMETTTQNAVLGSRLSIDDIKTSRVNDLMVANIQFRSKWSFSQEIKYRVHWFDQEGIEVFPERASWDSLVLTGKSERTVKVTAPSSVVTKLKVYVRN
jgi:uncharacterized protein YcfL